VNEPLSPSSPPPHAAPLPAQTSVALRAPEAHRATLGRWLAAGAFLLALLSIAALVLAVTSQQRVRSLERDLVRRLQEAQAQAADARAAGRAAQDASRDAVAKVALVEARVSEVALQRTQLEELIQSLSRSRDENVLSDVEASLRVAQQQSAITGSAEPLVATLRQADERLARYSQPRLERVRRALGRDLDRAKAVGVVDVSSLALRLDETIRQVDELPLLSSAMPGRAPAALLAAPAGPTPAVRRPAAAASASASVPEAASTGWAATLDNGWRSFSNRVWDEVRTLVRVTRIDVPEAALLSPDQAFFLRENLKLRLLNARLALLSRQFDTAQSDLRDAQASIERYFDKSARRVQATADTLRQVGAQARLVTVPRPDETLAAIQAAAAGR
jgi:uroporphyrin-3 C-methyltransferase